MTNMTYVFIEKKELLKYGIASEIIKKIGKEFVMDVKLEFGPFVSARRIQAGLTQSQMADELGYSVSMWSRIENGDRMPPRNVKMLKSIAAKINTDPGLIIELSRLEWVK